MHYKNIILTISFLAVFSLLFIPIGPAVKAQTANSTVAVDVQALIKTLQDQIAQLLAQITQLQSQQQNNTTLTWCHTFNTNLGFADSNSGEVAQLHTALQKENISYSPDSGNVYSDGTASAIVQFQEKYATEVLTPYGLTHGTGYVGPSTRKKLNMIYECKTIIPPPVQQRFIKIVSPNGGESFIAGESIKISWSFYGYSEKFDKVNISLVDENTENPLNSNDKIIRSSVPIGLGSYVWLGDTNVASGAKYKIRIEVSAPAQNIGYNLVSDVSDSYFSIVSSFQPFVQVLSPNGGEKWEIGKTYNIKYFLGNINVNPANPLYLWLEKWHDQPGKIGVNNTVLIGNISSDKFSYDYYVDSFNAPGDNYTVKICGGSWDGCDRSDSHFSIVVPTPESNLKVNIPATPKGAGATVAVTPVNGSSLITNYLKPIGLSIGDRYTVTPKNVAGYTATAVGSGCSAVAESNVSYVCDISYELTSVQPLITILSPNGGEQQQIGQIYAIKWTRQGYFPADVGYIVTLLKGGQSLYSESQSLYDIANSFKLPGNPSVDSEGNQYYRWKIPNESGIISGSDYKIEVKIMKSDGTTEIATDQSNGYFTIVAPTTTQPTITRALAPAANNLEIDAGGKFEIHGTNLASNNSSVQTFVYFANNGKDNATITQLGNNLIWAIAPSDLQVGSTYQLFISNDKGVSSPVTVRVVSSVQPSITVTSPKTGDALTVGQSTTIQWTGQNIPDGANYTITIYNGPNDGIYSPSKTIISGLPGSPVSGGTSAFTWVVEANTGNNGYGLGMKKDNFWDKLAHFFGIQDVYAAAGTNQYIITVCEYSGGGACGTSGVFTINPPAITIVSPNGGETLTAGQNMNVAWKTTGGVSTDNVKVYMVDYGGGNPAHIYLLNSTDLSGNAQSYTYSIPSNIIPSSKLMIDIKEFRNGNLVLRDLSDNYFSIVSASTCTYKNVLDSNKDGKVTRSEGEEVIRRVQAITGSQQGDANFVAIYDVSGDGRISSIDSLRLINDLNVCAPLVPAVITPNINNQLIASISDAITRIAESIKELFNK